MSKSRSSHASTPTFLQLCASGKALLEEVDDFVDRWHDDKVAGELRDYLGMSKEEYELWLQDPDILPHIVTARAMKRATAEVLKHNYYDEVRMAARSDEKGKIGILKRWLEKQGYLD